MRQMYLNLKELLTTAVEYPQISLTSILASF